MKTNVSESTMMTWKNDDKKILKVNIRQIHTFVVFSYEVLIHILVGGSRNLQDWILFYVEANFDSGKFEIAIFGSQNRIQSSYRVTYRI